MLPKIHARVIDSHAHLYDKKFGPELKSVLQRAKLAGVIKIINVAESLETSGVCLDMARDDGSLYATVGVHPQNIREWDDDSLRRLKRLARSRRAVAIGEIGLDYHYGESGRELQHQVLRAQIAVAHEVNKPLVLHCRDAYEDLRRLLREEEAGSVGGVVHCFSGSLADAEDLIDMGFKLGFGGIITYPNARFIREIARRVKIENILVETDSPYLAPQQKRGRRNEPANIRYVVKQLADLFEMTFRDIARQTLYNTIRLFQLPLRLRPSIAYPIRKTLYLNISTECTNNCFFCARRDDAVVRGYNLDIDHPPTIEEIMDSISDLFLYEEVVFRGLGEATLRLDVVKEIARQLRPEGIKIRLNTNGHCFIIHNRNIVPELQDLIDSICVVLNATSAEEYMRLCRPKFPPETDVWKAIMDFIEQARQHIPEVYIGATEAEGVDIEACRNFAVNTLHLPFRVIGAEES
ncbi:MAG: TatD family nuclease-associated radical SAM protein [Candidatus Sumerlaeia bacterium]